MKLRLWIIGLTLAALVSVWCQWPNSSLLEVTGCDVGQGDAFLIRLGFDQMLIDTGQRGGGVLECLGRHMPFWDKKIEMVVVTHDDSDHSGGVEEVIDHYQIGKLIVSMKMSHSTKPVWLKKAENEAIEVESIFQGTKLNIGQVEWECLWPRKEAITSEGEDKNDYSTVLSMGYIDFDVLFTSDIPLTMEEQLLTEGDLPFDLEVLKVAHHGSANSSGEGWINTMQPRVAMIGVGEKNSFGHPSREVIERFDNFHIQVLRTDKGEYTLVSDGSGFWVRE